LLESWLLIIYLLTTDNGLSAVVGITVFAAFTAVAGVIITFDGAP
jgi:hypothetical protein